MATFRVRTPTKTYWSATVGGNNVNVIAVDQSAETVTYVTTSGQTLKTAWASVTITDAEVLPTP